MSLYLLDTNVCIEYLRNRNQQVIQRVQARKPSEICLCSVVKAELYYGAYKSSQPASNLALLTTFCSLFVSLPFDDAAALCYGQIRAHLAAQGQMIGPNDLLIAAIALAHCVTLVTHNVSEFSRVRGLLLEDWQVP